MRTVPSLIKWTGSKRQLASQIVPLVPAHNRYFEPFLGGGALLYAVGNQESFAGDIYSPLIGLWTLFRDRPEVVISNYRKQWEALQKDLPGYYYSTRDRYNLTKDPLDLNFLLRTCVNGIVRFNKDGEFNNSFHLSRRGMRPQMLQRNLNLWQATLTFTHFRAGDYEETLADAKAGDFAYLDPPYVGNKQRYIGDLDLERFLGVLDGLNHRGVKWALSFDGFRGDLDYTQPVPKDLYCRVLTLSGGHSKVRGVLGRSVEAVGESLYLNY